MKLSQFNANTYKYDLIAENVYMREQEWFHYDFDLKNFEHILSTLAADDPKRVDYEKRIADTKAQMKIVEDVHGALLAQATDKNAYIEAVNRAAAKRAAQA